MRHSGFLSRWRGTRRDRPRGRGHFREPAWPTVDRHGQVSASPPDAGKILEHMLLFQAAATICRPTSHDFAGIPRKGRLRGDTKSGRTPIPPPTTINRLEKMAILHGRAIVPSRKSSAFQAFDFLDDMLACWTLNRSFTSARKSALMA